jgi:glycosyltransferase involved in cell wall biosynthesis
MALFSIIITTYNYGKYVDECVLSCLNQDILTDFEVIVVDDGSTDDTKEKLEKYKNTPLRIFINENEGIEGASNFGIQQALGKYIVRVDADDKLGNDFLYKMSKRIVNDKVHFYYSNYAIIDSDSNIVEEITLPPFDKNEIFSRGDFLATGTVYTKQALFNVGLYSKRVRNCGLENYELILKMLQNNYSGELVEDSLFYYRRHASNLSETRRVNIIEYGNGLFKEMDLGKYTTNSNHPYKLIIE